MLRGAELPEETPAEVKPGDLAPLLRLAIQGPQLPTALAEDMGLRVSEVRRSATRLEAGALITTDSQGGLEASPAGKALAADVLMALMVATFDPDMLDWLRAAELKAPFARTDGPGQL